MKRNVFALLRTFALVALVPTFSILVGCDPEIGDEVGNGSDTPSDSIVDNTGNGGVPSDSILGGNGDVSTDSIPNDDGSGNYDGIVRTDSALLSYGASYAELGAIVDLNLLPDGDENVEFGFEITGPDDDLPLRVTTTELSGRRYEIYVGGMRPTTEYTLRPFVTIAGEDYYGNYASITTIELEHVAYISGEVTVTHNSAVADARLRTVRDPREAVNVGVAWATSDSEFCAGGEFETYSIPMANVEDDEFICRIEGLTPNTTYYYASFTEAGGVYVFSTIKSFTTERYFPSGAVDLGLSVKWAGCNLGAESPEESGGYYAWGETEEKEEYTWSTYRYFESDGDGFISEEEMVFIGYNISGTAYDAAHVNLGNGWRMPTQKEVQELIEKCTVEIIRHNDVEGRMITGPNGNSIFLPITAVYQINSFHKERRGEYWTGTYDTGENTDGAYAHVLAFNQYSSDVRDSSLRRFVACSIRPVIE